MIPTGGQAVSLPIEPKCVTRSGRRRVVEGDEEVLAEERLGIDRDSQEARVLLLVVIQNHTLGCGWKRPIRWDRVPILIELELVH